MDSLSVFVQADFSSKLKLREPQRRLRREQIAVGVQLVVDNWTFAVDRNSRGEFLRTRRAVRVKANTVTHNAREHPCFVTCTVLRMILPTVRRWLNGRPRRGPERIDTSGFVENFRNMTAPSQNSDSQCIVLDGCG